MPAANAATSTSVMACSVIAALSVFSVPKVTTSPIAAPIPANRADCPDQSRDAPASPERHAVPISLVRWLSV